MLLCVQALHRVIGEVVLSVKESNRRTRESAFGLLIDIGERMMKVTVGKCHTGGRSYVCRCTDSPSLWNTSLLLLFRGKEPRSCLCLELRDPKTQSTVP